VEARGDAQVSCRLDRDLNCGLFRMIYCTPHSTLSSTKHSTRAQSHSPLHSLLIVHAPPVSPTGVSVHLHPAALSEARTLSPSAPTNALHAQHSKPHPLVSSPRLSINAWTLSLSCVSCVSLSLVGEDLLEDRVARKGLPFLHHRHRRRDRLTLRLQVPRRRVECSGTLLR
jgi:hypothetical protein